MERELGHCPMKVRLVYRGVAYYLAKSRDHGGRAIRSLSNWHWPLRDNLCRKPLQLNTQRSLRISANFILFLKQYNDYLVSYSGYRA